MEIFAAALDAELCPGDVFPADWDSDRPDAIGSVVIFSHGCEIDKPAVKTILVANITGAHETEKGLLGNIRAGTVWHALFLEGCRVPGWVNLRTLRPVPKDILLARKDRRLHSMTEDGRIALITKLYQFLLRALPPSSPTS